MNQGIKLQEKQEETDLFKLNKSCCKLSFDKGFTLDNLQLSSNVIPTISTILPYLQYNNDNVLSALHSLSLQL